VRCMFYVQCSITSGERIAYIDHLADIWLIGSSYSYGDSDLKIIMVIPASTGDASVVCMYMYFVYSKCHIHHPDCTSTSDGKLLTYGTFEHDTGNVYTDQVFRDDLLSGSRTKNCLPSVAEGKSASEPREMSLISDSVYTYPGGKLHICGLWPLG